MDSTRRLRITTIVTEISLDQWNFPSFEAAREPETVDFIGYRIYPENRETPYVSSGYHRHRRFLTHERQRAAAKTQWRRSGSVTTSPISPIIIQEHVHASRHEAARRRHGPGDNPCWTFDDKTATIHALLVFGIGSEVIRSFRCPATVGCSQS